jgi:acetyltransferase-like isoleucine patch superfamily enzyme
MMADAREVGEDNAIKFMVENKYFDGDFTLAKAGHHAGYYEARRTRLDFRGTLRIHPSVDFGNFIFIVTTSHDIQGGRRELKADASDLVDRPVIVDEGAFIGSHALLYNCHIKHHGIVACGAVVRNMTIEPYTVVEGNPAKAVKKFVDGKWIKV